MKSTRNIIVTAVLLVGAAFLTWAVYITLISGTTRGPNFIEGLHAGSISSGAVLSIEVVEPMVGGMPFTAREYDGLPRRRTIESPVTIKRVIWHLAGACAGQVPQNHPGSTYRAYLKVKTQSGFYWLYLNVLQDRTTAVLTIDSNTLNANNPNGASSYHLDNFSELLSILEPPNAEEKTGLEK